jgi:hypothetical protein
MKKARTVKQKVMGRPRTGITPLIGFRADPMTRAAIVKWAENQPDMPTLSEAIRRLVELGLSVAKPPAPTSAKTSARAKEMAGQAIDELADPEASTNEKASRKRSLISGPEEFRDKRVDRPKKK